MQLEINPPGIDSEYLRCLNACFAGWGDARMAQWAFERAVAPDPMPDLMVLREGDELLAGSAVSYRSVTFSNGGTIRAGIMTGSWTLPAARGRGCFARMIEESAVMTREHGGALLLAFVTEDNPSCRQLLKAGAATIPTSYFFTGPENTSIAADVFDLTVLDGAELADEIARWQETRAGKCRFAYADFAGWRGQFMDRPASVEAVRSSSDAFAVVEKAASTDRVLAWWAPSQTSALQLFQALRMRASGSGRKVFSFSTDSAFVAQCATVGFERKAGYLTILATDWERLGRTLQVNAPQPIQSQALTVPENPWFTGEWEIQSGDRM